MPNRQDILIYAAAVLGDGAWLFVALGIAGFIAGQGGSPLAWPVVFILLIAAIVATRAVAAIGLPHPDPAVVQMGLGVIAAYAAVACSNAAGGGGVEPLWAWRFAAGDYEARTGAGMVVGVLGAVFVWRHGMLMTAADLPEGRLHRSFRLGVLAFGLGLLLELGSGRDLGATGMLLPFFVGSLAALAMARIRHNNATGASWIRVIGATVVGVVGLGLGLALAGGAVVRETATIATHGWSLVADGLLWVARLILVPIARVIAMAIEWVLTHIPRATGTPPVRQQGIRWWEQLGLDAASPEEAIGTLLLYPMLILLLALVCWILLKAYRRGVLHRRTFAIEYRERIEGNAAADLARLLAAALPSWLRPKQEPVARWRFPQGEPGISDAFRLYYDTLDLATARGSIFDPCLTPTERIPVLARVLPSLPVGRITACFIAACYGHKRIDAAEAAALRDALDATKASAPPSA